MLGDAVIAALVERAEPRLIQRVGTGRARVELGGGERGEVLGVLVRDHRVRLLGGGPAVEVGGSRAALGLLLRRLPRLLAGRQLRRGASADLELELGSREREALVVLALPRQLLRGAGDRKRVEEGGVESDLVV